MTVWAAFLPILPFAPSLPQSDRAVGTHWFNPSEGGDALLWQHIFWFFGHPEVYIIFLPALGFITSIVETFSRRRVFGYTAIVLANITTGFFALTVSQHSRPFLVS